MPSCLDFLGWGLIGVLAAGTVVFWRDRRLWFYGAMALITAAVSLTVAEPYWDPWKALQHLPQFMNIIEERFSVAVYLAWPSCWPSSSTGPARPRCGTAWPP